MVGLKWWAWNLWDCWRKAKRPADFRDPQDSMSLSSMRHLEMLKRAWYAYTAKKEWQVWKTRVVGVKLRHLVGEAFFFQTRRTKQILRNARRFLGP